MTSPLSRRAGCALALVLSGAVAGCARPPDLFREPPLSPVGSGFVARADPAIVPISMPPPPPGNSLFGDGSASLFTDLRAARIGDVITVFISINDKASFGNTSGRSQTAQEADSAAWVLGMNTTTNTIAPNATLNSSSTSNGQGSIDRSEKIQLSVAAMVTRVLPNGNLVIRGSQEVRVNFEMRQLLIAGIVRPADIIGNNTIAYDKIAEARISYGGRGRISEVQQPSWGQQVFDVVKPF